MSNKYIRLIARHFIERYYKGRIILSSADFGRLHTTLKHSRSRLHCVSTEMILTRTGLFLDVISVELCILASVHL